MVILELFYFEQNVFFSREISPAKEERGWRVIAVSGTQPLKKKI